MQRLLYLQTLLLLPLSASAWSLTGNEIDPENKIHAAILRQLDLPAEDMPDKVLAENPLPFTRHSAVIVLGKYHEAEEYSDFDTHIIVYDTQTYEIAHRYFGKEEIASDAIYATSVWIDTAPYQLAEHTRAFGMRVSYRGSSRANPYSCEDISLFIHQGDRLLKVLDKYTISYSSGDNTSHEEDGRRIFTYSEESERGLIIIDRERTKGLANLRIKKTKTTSVSYDYPDSEIESGGDPDTVERTTEILRFDGTEYK